MVSHLLPLGMSTDGFIMMHQKEIYSLFPSHCLIYRYIIHRLSFDGIRSSA